MADKTYAWAIRVFHALFASAILLQLAVGELMDVPEVDDDHGEAFSWITTAFAHENEGGSGGIESSWLFEVHEFLGLFIAGLLVVRVLLAMSQLSGANWRDLFPWASAEGRSQLVAEFKTQMSGWMRLKLATPEASKLTAKTMHGLLLLAAAVMAVTGTILYWGWSTTAPQSMWIETVAGVHETVVGGLMGLIALHILAVILHERQGHKVLNNIKP
ncbi:MAG: cytochrome b/b6 domain-containing protein [Ghiorsea sp.]|nr:cytochrome b/b6 domain-containing protein [Ghiorsea sp.]